MNPQDLKIPEMPQIVIEGRKIDRKIFKTEIAKIATDFNDGKIKDLVISSDFNEREELYAESKEIKEEFDIFQNNYLEKLRNFSTKIVRIHGAIDSCEKKIYKQYNKLQQEKKDGE